MALAFVPRNGTLTRKLIDSTELLKRISRCVTLLWGKIRIEILVRLSLRNFSQKMKKEKYMSMYLDDFRFAVQNRCFRRRLLEVSISGHVLGVGVIFK